MAKGLIVANIGTPSAATPAAVGRYLTEFLMDENVIQLPWLARILLVRGLIVPFRKRSSAKKYAKIFTDRGSPLLWLSQDLAAALQSALGDGWFVEVGMQYGASKVDEALARLRARGASEIFVLPFFPQYSEATHGPVLAWARERGLRALRPFPTDDFFVNAWVRSLGRVEADETLLFSFHGLPESQVRKLCDCLDTGLDVHGENCYRGQCFATARAIAARLGVGFEVAFQSRLGRSAWLQPYSTSMVAQLASRGVKKLRVACPSFTVDCLESLEEIQLELRAEFLAAGGESFICVPCPNAEAQWAADLAEFVRSESV